VSRCSAIMLPAMPMEMHRLPSYKPRVWTRGRLAANLQRGADDGCCLGSDSIKQVCAIIRQHSISLSTQTLAPSARSLIALCHTQRPTPPHATPLLS